MQRRKISVIGICCCLFALSNAIEFPRIKANFRKESIINGKKEQIEGILYLISPKKVFLEVKKPVIQNVAFKDDLMMIYYPAEKIGFEIETELSAHYLFFNAFLSVTLEKILSSMGYKLVSSKKERETISNEYKPKRRNPFVSTVTITKSKNEIQNVRIRDKTGKVICETLYEDYIKLGKIVFPKKITTVMYKPTGNIDRECIMYDDVEVTPTIPSEIADFTFPKGTNIKRVKF